MGRGYQYDFSVVLPSMYDVPSRIRKAKTMVAVLADFLGGTQSLADLALLDVGASTGIIDHHLAAYCKKVVGVDIDSGAIVSARQQYIRENLEFIEGDAMQLPFPDESFDVVICAQVYEHVPDSRKLLDEIFRVLKPAGVCYFSAGNRLNVIEPHYRLPGLSLLPKPLAHWYMQLTGKGDHYYEEHLTYWGLKRLTSRFVRYDYTRKAVHDPDAFEMRYMLNPDSMTGWLARCCVDYLYWAFPNYLWILQKPICRQADQIKSTN